MTPIPPKLDIHPVTADRWDDLERLFGKRGACGGCWCMWWRLRRAEFVAAKGEGNRASMKLLVASGAKPGLVAYVGGQPVGWVAVAPRDQYPGLQRSRILRPVDDQPVWSVSCLFVSRTHRRRGVSLELLRAAVAFVRKNGGKIVEGYPQEPRSSKVPDAFAWTGLASTFRAAGFEECARRSPTRPVMRLALET
jgi:GNAT superfamily N-acetyltransferase